MAVIAHSFLIDFFGDKYYICTRMKNVRHILIALLSLCIIYLGAGVVFVHICSTYCHELGCSPSADTTGRETHREHIADKECCDFYLYGKGGNRFQECPSCLCLNITYLVDFFPRASQQSQQPDMNLPVELPARFSVGIPSVTLLLSAESTPNAPPVRDGRTLLTFHSTLII